MAHPVVTAKSEKELGEASQGVPSGESRSRCSLGRNMKAATAVAEILKREGVEFLIGYPVNAIIEASARADIRTIIVRQERTGLHMADALSRGWSGEKVRGLALPH